jgi:GNAT superfamily N-acetyltransferase
LADRMLADFEQQAARRGIIKVYLTTDAEHNDHVNSFYRKNGYTVECNFMQNGARSMQRYIKNIELKNHDE